MLPTRQKSRFARTGRRQQLVEGRQTRGRRPITEETDLHKASVIHEAKKNQLVRKWSPVLGKCREVPQQKFGLMAAILENQYNAWNPENRSIILEDQTTTANIADFTRFALPLIRKSYPKLIADNLVGVQPMSQPDPYYSSQEVRGEDATITGGTVISGTLAHRPVLAGTVTVEVFESEADASPNCDDAVPCLRVSFDSDGAPDVILIGDCTSLTDTLVVDSTTTGATEFSHSTGQIQVTLSGGEFPAGAISRVNYEYDLEANPFQPEVTLSIDSDSVAAITRKLKTSWSLEAAQDLKAVHNIDAESTLTDLMADEMVAEIDREIINDLIIAAAIRADHNFATAAGASVNFTDRNIALMYKVLEVANIIHRTTLRGPANWMVMSADICSKFEQLNDFRASDAFTTEGVDIGIMNIGTIQGKMKIYKDPLFPNCKILMGFKGSSVLDAGYFYAPYIPLLSTPTVLDPNSFTPNKGIMCRYGKKLIEDGGLYYATINVSNL